MMPSVNLETGMSTTNPYFRQNFLIEKTNEDKIQARLTRKQYQP